MTAILLTADPASVQDSESVQIGLDSSQNGLIRSFSTYEWTYRASGLLVFGSVSAIVGQI